MKEVRRLSSDKKDPLLKRVLAKPVSQSFLECMQIVVIEEGEEAGLWLEVISRLCNACSSYHDLHYSLDITSSSISNSQESSKMLHLYRRYN